MLTSNQGNVNLSNKILPLAIKLAKTKILKSPVLIL